MSSLLIHILADDQPGVQARLAVTLRRGGADIIRQHRADATAPGQQVYRFEVHAAPTATDWLAALTALPFVLKASTGSGEGPSPRVAAPPSAPETAGTGTDPLESVVRELVRAYPDFVGQAWQAQRERGLSSEGMDRPSTPASPSNSSASRVPTCARV